jgi:hypothetical protein
MQEKNRASCNKEGGKMKKKICYKKKRRKK